MRTEDEHTERPTIIIIIIIITTIIISPTAESFPLNVECTSEFKSDEKLKN